jgi:signal transduction histidine kinase/FixJ family two-component response regulator
MPDTYNAPPAFLATEQPGPGQRRLAFAVFALSLAFFAAAAPFAKVKLAEVWAFIPIYQSALVVSDLITAALLLGQFRILRSRALAVLACGYLFTAFIAAAHALTFPGLFAPAGLLGAGPQTTAWMYMFWHAGFPLFVIAYAMRKDAAPGAEAAPTGGAIVASVAGAFGLAAAVTLAATAGQSLLPAIMVGHQYTPVMIVVVSSTWIFSLLGLLVLWRRRPHSMLDLWLMVVLCAWMFDIALSAVLNQGRFDLGFYAGRIYGLLASCFVLMMLLLENGLLYAQLARTHARERERSAELQRLSSKLEAANTLLAENNARLQQASRLKSDFLANMSHELRTPLNAIIGFSEVLKEGLAGDLEAQQTEYVTDIHNSGKHLLALINDILDLSKVEAGKMTLELECLDIGQLVQASLQVVRERAVEHRLHLAAEVEAGLGSVWLDARKTRQILYNLLSNAAKFTPDGGSVTLAARKVAGSEAPGIRFVHCLELKVSDTGIGISAEDQTRLFQPFTQIDSELSRRYEGTGLGLALVKRLAELHGGTVALRSEPGKGSIFTVWLPWRTEADSEPTLVPPAPPPALASPPLPGVAPLALVIEDDDLAANLLRVQLEENGFEVVRCSSAELGRAFLADRRPNVIILDILLPQTDGWQFLERLREEPEFAALPVVVVSIVADEHRGLALGAAQVLQKPVSRAELLAAMEAIGLPTDRGNGRAAQEQQRTRESFIGEVRRALSGKGE